MASGKRLRKVGLTLMMFSFFFLALVWASITKLIPLNDLNGWPHYDFYLYFYMFWFTGFGSYILHIILTYKERNWLFLILFSLGGIPWVIVLLFLSYIGHLWVLIFFIAGIAYHLRLSKRDLYLSSKSTK